MELRVIIRAAGTFISAEEKKKEEPEKKEEDKKETKEWQSP